jgi:DNA-directed RNA polymerase II subunit RPB2
MKVSQKVRRLGEDRQADGEAQWLEDEIYPDVDIDKAYVGRVSCKFRLISHIAPCLTKEYRSLSC